MRKYSLAILCILLVSIGLAYSADATEVKISNPPDGAIVSKNVDVGLTIKRHSCRTRLLDLRISHRCETLLHPG